MLYQNDSRNPSRNADEQPRATAESDLGGQGDKAGDGSNPETSSKETVQELAREFRWVEIAQIGSSMVLAVVGIIALCIYAGQLGQMKKSTKAAQDAAQIASDTLAEIRKGSSDTHELAVQAKNQADATRGIAERATSQVAAATELAKQSRRSADVAAQALEAQERPWLGVPQLYSNVSPLRSNVPITFTLVIRNVGHSPAILQSLQFQSSFWQGDLPESPPYDEHPSGPAGYGIVFPGEEHRVDVPVTVTEFGMKELAEDRVRLYIYGKIKYTYSQGSRVEHTTQYCGYIVPDSNPLKIRDCTNHYSYAD
jgi:hypothetical protein